MRSKRANMESERIERQYQDSKELCDYLISKGEITFATYIDSVYKKVLVLSAASFFESVISKQILAYTAKTSGSDKRIVVLVENKVIERQYHTLFDWKANNTNVFLKLFGTETQNKAREEINSNVVLKTAESDFMELGKLRNMLVHENFAEYDVNITLGEIYTKYKSACNFLSFIEKVLDTTYLKK